MDDFIKKFNLNYVQQLKNDILYLESAFAVYSVSVNDPKLLLLHQLFSLLSSTTPDQFLIESVKKVKYPFVTKEQAKLVMEKLIAGDKSLNEDIKNKFEKTLKVLRL